MKRIIQIILFALIHILPVQIYAQSCNEGDQDSISIPKPKPDKHPSDSTKTPVQASVDPNEIIGVRGFDSLQWVKIDDQLAYTIYFENDPEFATAAAQKVSVRYKFDPKADMTSFGLGSFGFGSFIFPIEDAPAIYQKRLDVRDSLGIYVDVVAGLDVVKKEAFWIFSSIDPETGLAPLEVHKGFLPVNDKEKHNGEGFVNFVMKAKTTCATRDTISASASIVFDTNDAIPTNVWMNTIDTKAPTSKLKGQVDTADNTHYLLSFEAADDEFGSGVRQITVYISQNKEAYKELTVCAPDSVLGFTVPSAAEYAFYSIATDNTGNVESQKKEADFILNSNTPPTDIVLSDTVFFDDIIVDEFIGELSSIDSEDNNVFTYALAEGEGAIHNDLFRISGTQLQAGSSFKCVEDSVYKIRISTTDVGGLSFEKAFVLSMKSVLVKPQPDSLSIQICEGDSYEFYGKEYSQTGYYVYTKSNDFACDSIYVLNLRVNPYPAVPLITVEGTHTLVSSALNYNQWYDESGLIEGSAERSFTPQKSGFYWVTTSNGTCESKPSEKVYVDLSNETNLNWDLNKDWNWISINTNEVANAVTLFEPIKNSFSRLVGYSNELVNDPEYGLIGGLSELNNIHSYKLDMKEQATTSLKGMACSTGDLPVQLRKGWNWLGYLPVVELDLSTALGNLTAGEGDVIKSQTDFVMYDGGKWTGTLTSLKPGEGYMYRSMSDKLFNYSSIRVTSLYMGTSSLRATTLYANYWSLNEHKYPNNMNIVARLYQNGAQVETGIFTVGAFSGKECRGIGKCVNGVLFITIHGQENGETIRFKAMENATQKEVDIQESVVFGETIIGKPTQPFRLNMNGPTDLSFENMNFTIYPNPVRNYLFIGCDTPEILDIQILNTAGALVLRLDSYQQENGVDVSLLPDGAYVIAIHTASGMLYRKFMKTAMK